MKLKMRKDLLVLVAVFAALFVGGSVLGVVTAPGGSGGASARSPGASADLPNATADLPGNLRAYQYDPNYYAEGLTDTEPSAENGYRYKFNTGEFNRWLSYQEEVIGYSHNEITSVNTTYGASQLYFDDTLGEQLDYDNQTIAGVAEEGEITESSTGHYPAQHSFHSDPVSQSGRYYGSHLSWDDNSPATYEPDYISPTTVYAPDVCTDAGASNYDWWTGYHGSGSDYCNNWKKAADWEIDTSAYNLTGEELHIEWEMAPYLDSVLLEAKVIINGTQYGDVKSKTGTNFGTFSVDVANFGASADSIDLWVRIDYVTDAFFDDFHVDIGGGYDSSSAETSAENDIPFVDECDLSADGDSYIGVGDYGGHSKALQLHDGSSADGDDTHIWKRLPDNRTLFEFWYEKDSTASQTKTNFELYEGGEKVAFLQFSMDSVSCYDGSWTQFASGVVSAGEWYHAAVELEPGVGWDFRLDGAEKGSDLNFLASPVEGFDELEVSTAWNGGGFSARLDACGFGGHAGYSSGDNANPYGRPDGLSPFVDGYEIAYGAEASVRGDYGGHSKYLNLTDNSGDDLVSVSRDLPEQPDPWFEFWVGKSAVASQSQVSVNLLDSEGNQAITLALYEDDVKSYHGGWNDVKTGSVAAGEWYRFRIAANDAMQTFECYIGGQKEGTMEYNDLSAGLISTVQLTTYGANTGYTAFFDAFDPSSSPGYYAGRNSEPVMAVDEQPYYGGRILEDEIHSYDTYYINDSRSTQFVSCHLDGEDDLAVETGGGWSGFEPLAEYYIGGTPAYDYLLLRMRISKEPSGDFEPLMLAPFSQVSGSGYALQGVSGYEAGEWFTFNLTFPEGEECDGFTIYAAGDQVDGDFKAELRSIETPRHTFDEYDIELTYNLRFYYNDGTGPKVWYKQYDLSLTKSWITHLGVLENVEIEQLEIHFQMRSTPEPGQLSVLTTFIINQNATRVNYQRTWSTGISWGYYRIQFGNFTYSSLQGDSVNALRGVRNFYEDSDSKVYSFYELPYFQEDLGLIDPWGGGDDEDEKDTPGDYWTYTSWVLEKDYDEQIDLTRQADFHDDELTLDLGYTFTHIRGVEHTAKFYYTTSMIQEADLGDWSTWILDFNWLRNGIVWIMNAVLFVVQFLLYLVVVALNFIVGLLFFSLLIPFLWNVPVFWFLYAMLYLLSWLLSFLVWVLGLLLGVLVWLLKDVILPALTFVAANAIPMFVGMLSWIVALLVWALSLGQADIFAVQQVVEHLLLLLSDAMVGGITFFVTYLPAFLGYLGSYFVVIGMLYAKLLYCRWRGLPHRVKQLTLALEAYAYPVRMVFNFLQRVKDLLFGWL